MEERPEPLENEGVELPEEDGSPQGVAENVREAGKALLVTFCLGLVALTVCLGAAIGYTLFLEGIDSPFSYYKLRVSHDLIRLIATLFGLLFVLAGAGYAFRKFSLEKARKAVFWLMGGAVVFAVVATVFVTVLRG